MKQQANFQEDKSTRKTLLWKRYLKRYYRQVWNCLHGMFVTKSRPGPSIIPEQPCLNQGAQPSDASFFQLLPRLEGGLLSVLVNCAGRHTENARYSYPVLNTAIFCLKLQCQRDPPNRPAASSLQNAQKAQKQANKMC